MTSSRIPNRRGWILPVVLLCGLLLGADLFLFQAISSSDYSQVRRLTKGAQASALTDLASDEIYLHVYDVASKLASGDFKKALPQWGNELLQRLETARAGARGTPAHGLDVRMNVDIREELSATLEASRQLGGGLTVHSARLRIGPFHTVAGVYDPKVFYSEPIFKDGEKDPVPWDLRGPFTVDVTIGLSRGPFMFERRFLRTQTLAITDTSPPAGEFALFNYLPPPDEDYALNDLSRGGRLTIFPVDAGRVMVRGPLLLAPEDAPKEKPFLGGKRRPEGTFNYPTPGSRAWTGWGAVPGPRALQYPLGDSANTAKQEINAIVKLFGVDPIFADLGPRRPKTAGSPPLTFGPLGPFDVGAGPAAITLGPWGPWTIDLSFLIAVGVERLASVYLPLNDDEISYFSSGPYFFAPLEQGKQTFSILGGTQFVATGGGQPTSISMFRGARLRSDLTQAGAPYDKGLKGLPDEKGKEGETILPEPVPQNNSKGLSDTGLVGYYQVALFDASTLFSISALELFGPLVCSVIGPEGTAACSAITKAISYLGLDASPRFMCRQYDTKVKAPLPVHFEFSAIEEGIKKRDLMIVPYGLYRHTDDFWSSGTFTKAFKEFLVNTIANDVFKFGLDKIVGFIGKLLKGTAGKAAVEAAESETGVLTKEIMQVSEKVLIEVEEASAGILKFLADSFTGQYFAKIALNRLKPWVTDPIKNLINKAFSMYPPEPPKESMAAEAFASVGTGTGSLVAEYSKGFFPPKFREWEKIATRTYPDLQAWLAAEQRNGVIELRGAVLIRRLDYHGPPIRYRGRGILVVQTSDSKQPATLDAVVEPDSAAIPSYLILAHRVTDQAAKSGALPALRLGQKFVGSVYSDTGVAPAGQATLILGNLVTGLLNKGSINASLTSKAEGVFVRYTPSLAKSASEPTSNFWTLDLVGDISSTGPVE